MKLDKDLFACFSHIILNVNEYRWTAHIFIFLMPIQEIKSKYTHSLICLCVFTIQDISFCLLYKRSSYYQSYISDISLFNAQRAAIPLHSFSFVVYHRDLKKWITDSTSHQFTIHVLSCAATLFFIGFVGDMYRINRQAGSIILRCLFTKQNAGSFTRTTTRSMVAKLCSLFS